MNIVLLDADIIIFLHQMGSWSQITSKCQIKIPSIVLRNEAFFYEDKGGHRHSINLADKKGLEYEEIAVSALELRAFTKKLEGVLIPELHKGEIEALCILAKKRDLLFCTCDGAAIQVLAAMGLSSQGISFERLLRSCGLTKKLEYKHSEKKFKKHLSDGSIMRILGEGVK